MTLFMKEDVLDYVQDFVFVAHDENGKIDNKFFQMDRLHLTKVEPMMLELLMLV